MKKHYFAYEMFSKYRGAIMGIQILLIVFVIVIPLLYTVLMMRKIDMIEVIRNENE